MKNLINKYIDRIKIDYPEDDKLYIDLEAFANEVKQQLTIHSVVSSEKNKDAIIYEMKKLTDDERLDVISEFCKYCGGLDNSCQCWNDE